MSDEIVNLAALDDAGFQRFYVERIAPCFAANEADRVAAVATFRQRLWIGAPVVLAAAIVVSLWAHDVFFGVFAAIVVGFGFYWWADGPLRLVKTNVKTQSLGAIASAIGAVYELGGFQPPALDRFKQHRLLPSFNRQSFEDLFSGAHAGARFELYEAHLQQHRQNGKNSSTVTVFRGQLLRLAFPKRFLGLTIVRRDAGVFNMFGGGGELKRVGLVDPKFEKVFEVYSNDQVEARYLVHPVFMERLMQLEEALQGKKLRCAFEGGDLLIAIEGGDLFEPGSLFQPLVDPERARRIVNDVGSILRVMDAVLTAEAPRR